MHYVESVSVQVQAVACTFPPQQRTSDHLFSPSGDHKALTRMCVKCRVVLSAPSGMQASLSVSTQTVFFMSSPLSFFVFYLSPSLNFSLSEYRSEQCVPEAGAGMQVCSIHRPKAEQSRAAQAVITSRTSLCMCGAESEQPQ